MRVLAALLWLASAFAAHAQLGPLPPGGTTSTPIVKGSYTAAGAIAVGDDYSYVASATAVTMTLADGTTDQRAHRIYQTGAGTVTVTANICGTIQSVPLATNGTLRSSLALRWSADTATYVMD